jgi:hypothetical protein
MDAFVALTAASAIVTKLVDTTRNLLGDDGQKFPKWLWNVEAFGLGLAGAFLFQIEPVQVPDSFRFEVSGAALQAATGLMVGAVASGLHEFFALLSAKSKR